MKIFREIFTLCFILSGFVQYNAIAENPYPGSPPFSFSIPEQISLDQFIVVSPLYSNTLRFVFRSDSKIYAYDHNGNQLWSQNITNPRYTYKDRGSKHGVADVDGDGVLEIVAVNNSNQIKVFSAEDGILERTIDVTVDNSYQKVTYMSLANLRGHGLRDVVVQTRNDPWDGTEKVYINRTIIAFNLESGEEMWRVSQNENNHYGGWYEGYWGQAHGGLICGDMDGDGLDEVVGGRMIDDDGTPIDLGYDESWVDRAVGGFLDHIDCIAFGDFHPELKGLELVLCHEDHAGTADCWQTVMLRYNESDPGNGVMWRRSIHELFPNDSRREPQNVAVGNFVTSLNGLEIWNRSRFGGDADSYSGKKGQYPWMYDADTNLVAHYAMEDTLPAGFNTSPKGNGEGVEIIWTIDWTGGEEEYLAAQARHSGSNIGIFKAVDFQPIWQTTGSGDVDSVIFIYVADIGGDSREEIIAYDIDNGSDHKIKIWWNTDTYSDTRPKKWNDPLYLHLKQTWNYYSPGSYTRRDPVEAQIRVYLEGGYDCSEGGLMRTDIKDYGFIPLTSPYVEDRRIVDSIPENVVDWILIQLRLTSNGHTVISRSCFLRNDGMIIDENGDTNIDLFVEKQNYYYIIVKHRNHLAVMSSDSISFAGGSVNYDFTTSEDKYFGGSGAAKDLGGGLWGMIAGDGNDSGIVTMADRNGAMLQRDASGYNIWDFNLSGIVTMKDVNMAFSNRDAGTKVPNNN